MASIDIRNAQLAGWRNYDLTPEGHDTARALSGDGPVPVFDQHGTLIDLIFAPGSGEINAFSAWYSEVIEEALREDEERGQASWTAS